jgi:uncharacterized protein (TIGR03435 family)
MTRTLAIVAIVVFMIDHGHCQEPVKPPAFEVASITPCKPGTPEPPGEHMSLVQFTAPGGRFRAQATTLKFLLEWAYGIQPAQHSAGPSWMGSDRYDVVAKAEGNPTDQEMKLMVQTLLAERFRLKMHHEIRKMNVFVVTAGKTPPNLDAPKDGEVHSMRVVPRTGVTDQKTNSFHVIATRYSLGQLTDTFARQMGRVIVNKTGLNGEYDFELDLTPDENEPNPLDASVLMDALRRQLGLTLKTEDAQVDYLAIEGAEKVAAGN